MTPKYIEQMIKQGEGLTMEFKQAREKLNRNVYETICAFLNRQGGVLLLGVADNGRVTGITPEAVGPMKKDIVTTLHNLQKINPPVYLLPEEVMLENETVLCISVPESSQVHFCNGRIFDRGDDGDFDITGHSNRVAELYLRKQSTYSENRIFPYVEMTDLRTDLLERVRHMTRMQRRDHPWADMDDLELLKSARLFQKDYATGKEGMSLAGVLLFGRDEVIAGVVSHHRTDAILRVHDLNRYDDRDDIRTNLIESYDRLMAFVAKHLPDPFFLEGDMRVSLRDRIFREVVANMLIHREYINPFPAKLIIHGDRVTTENANKPHGSGVIDPNNFSPYPKNPLIARVFKEIARADELGSGVRNLYHYCTSYGGKSPVLEEENIFRMTIAIPQQATQQATQQAERERTILAYCEIPRTRIEIQEKIGIKDREYFRSAILQPLLDKGLLILTDPDKPKSPNQKYKTKRDSQ